MSDGAPSGTLRRWSVALVVYNVCVCALVVLAAPFVGLGLLLRPRWRVGLADRLGLGWPQIPKGERTLWAHAASVGEMEGVLPLVSLWQERYPEGRIFVTSLTSTGCGVARAALPSAEVRLFPLDLPGLASRLARRVSPDLFLFSENEIWPNLLVALSDQGSACVQVSGRLSTFAASALGRFRSLCAFVLGRVTCFCVQTEADRDRLFSLGVNFERVSITGSLKADARRVSTPEFLGQRASSDRPILVVGSTHEGEEAVVLEAIKKVRSRGLEPWWILAPRHPERFDMVARMLDDAGIGYVRRSSLGSSDGGSLAVDSEEVLLLDSIGELSGCFTVAAGCFIGGSLVPIGGHNLLEPARSGVPILVGPHLDSVHTLAAQLEKASVLQVVRDAEEFAEAVLDVLSPDRAADRSAAARRVASDYGGSLARTWSCLLDMNLVERA